jgi:hypothetical protein
MTSQPAFASLLAFAVCWGAALSAGEEPLAFPPALPDGAAFVTLRSEELLRPPSSLREGVEVARTPPSVDFLYYPGQTYPGKPWSAWGDGLARGGKYYSAIGDHLAPAGNALVFEYDPEARSFRKLVDVKELLGLPEGHYVPGKVHGRIDLGSDGWLYFSTHRGSTRVTTDQYHYEGDWIIRHHPATGRSEIVAHGPVPKHCIPTSVLDPERLIFYGGTAAGDPADRSVRFFAYDIRRRRVLHSAPEGPYRALIFARSTGKVYWAARDGEPLFRYDPESGEPPVAISARLGLRAATKETAGGSVYTVSTRGDGRLWRFDVKTEKAFELGAAAVGTQDYITSLDVDPAGRYLYYAPGAHGGSERDGTPVVQLDLESGKKKVIAFLHPLLQKEVGYTPAGTFTSALDEEGKRLFITWNGSRAGPDRQGRYRFDTCALAVIHIPESERLP